MDAVRVLQIVVGGKKYNGVVSFLYQFYKHIDHQRVHFDFFVVRENAFESRKDDPVFADSTFYILNAVKKNNRTDHLKMMRELGRILENEKYDAVHINTMAIGAQAPLIRVCKKHHVKTIVAHSHNEYATTISASKLLAHKLLQPFVVKNADCLFACSVKAGECLFGKAGVASEKFRVINNAIDPDQFGFSEEIRNRVRDAFGVLRGTAVIGQVGRLSAQKNQSFALDVFRAFHDCTPDAQFWIVGDGEDRESLEEKVRQLGLESSVFFLGQRNDVNELLTAMDVLLAPSRWEGLPVALIEAQSTGIPILASSSISKETSITDLMHFLPLDAGAEAWSAELDPLVRHGDAEGGRRSRREDLAKSGFSISEEAKKLENFFCGRKNETPSP